MKLIRSLRRGFFYLTLTTSLLLVGCNTDSSNSDNSSNDNSNDTPALNISSNDTVLQGSSMQILVSLASLSQNNLIVGSNATSQSISNVTFNFIDTDDYSKFNISYSSACSSLSAADTCTITLTPNSNALNLSGNQVTYYISALSGSAPLISDIASFSMKTLNLSTTVDNLGAGTSEILTVSNNSGVDLDLTGAQFSSDSSNVSFSDNSCNGMLADQQSCTVTVTANNAAASQSAFITMTNTNGTTLFSDPISIVRPDIGISPNDEINLEPNETQVVTISNNSSVDIKGLTLDVPTITGVYTSVNNCGTTLPAGSSCIITLIAGTNPNGEGVMTVSADNADSQTKALSATTPSLLSIALSQDYIVSNSLANKQITVTVQNTSDSTSVSNLSLSFSPTLPSFNIIPFLSSCDYLADGILLPQQNCQYTLAVNPAETSTALSQTTNIQVNAENTSTQSKSLSSTIYPKFYTLPANAYNITSATSGYLYAMAIDSNIAYIGSKTAGLSISTDGGQTWVNKTTANGLAGNTIQAISTHNGSIYVGTSSGLSISTNGGYSWTNSETPNGLSSGANITSIYISNNTIYLGKGMGSNATGEKTYGGIDISTDDGKTWKSSKDTPAVTGVYAANGTVYAVTTGGLYTSNDGENFSKHEITPTSTVNTLSGDGNTIYAGTTTGELYISNDNGTTWTSYSTLDGYNIQKIYAILANGDNVYVNTLEGLFISNDRGEHWILNTNLPGSKSSQRLYYSDSNRTIYVYTLYGSVYTSADNGITWQTSKINTTNLQMKIKAMTVYNNKLFVLSGQVYELTNNNTVWSQITNTKDSNTLDGSLTALVSHDGILYIGTSKGKIYSSSDGNTWQLIADSGLDNIMSIAFDDNNTIFAVSFSQGLAYSTDDGTSWIYKTTEDGLGSNSLLSIVYNNGTLYAAGNQGGGVSYSNDGGVSWKNYPSLSGINALFANEGTLYAGTTNGLFYSNDNGSHWDSYRIDNSGLESNVVNAVVASGNTIYAGTDNGLSVSTDKGNTWTTYTTNDGLGNTRVISIAISGSTIYVSTSLDNNYNYSLSALTQVGNTWRNINSTTVSWLIGARPTFVTNGTIYTSGEDSVQISTDGGNSWINKELPDSTNSEISGIFSVGNNIYVSAIPGGLYISTDSGNTWKHIANINDLGGDIAYDVFVNGSAIYLATENGLFISYDNGQSWITKTKEDGLGANIVYAVFAEGNTVYAATNAGLSISIDSGQSWENKTKENGLVNNYINDVFVDGNNIYAATNAGLSISTDSGQNWVNKTTANGLQQTPIKKVFVVGNTIYAVSSNTVGFGPGAKVESSLNVSKDGGNTWQSYGANEGLEGDIISVFALGSTVYVGTEEGLFVSLDTLQQS